MSADNTCDIVPYRYMQSEFQHHTEVILSLNRILRTKSNTIHILSVNGVNIARIELTNPPKLTILKNGILQMFASIEYVLNVLK